MPSDDNTKATGSKNRVVSVTAGFRLR